MNKKLNEFLNKIAYIKESDIEDDDGKCYHSKIDGSYITHVGMEEELPKTLLNYGITEQIQNSSNNSNETANIGFNPIENRWYGWSHRALYGFGIGSKVEKGNCAYIPKDEADAIEAGIRFWADEDHINIVASEVDTVNDVKGVWLTWTFADAIPNKTMRKAINCTFWKFPKVYGKGEWTAKTIEDAKQMAIDFAHGVS